MWNRGAGLWLKDTLEDVQALLNLPAPLEHRVLVLQFVPRTSLVCLLWLVATLQAAAQDFKLGVTQSARIEDQSHYGVSSLFAATDSQGYVYLLGNEISYPSASYLIKLTPALDRVMYRTSFEFEVWGMAVDPAGNAYIAGDNFVQKMSSDGNRILYRTAFGGIHLAPANIAVDAAGRAYVVGIDPASDLKTTPGVFQPKPSASVFTGFSGFVVRLKPDGAIDYATYLADSRPAGVAVDDEGSAYVTGTAPADFPVTPGAYRATGNSFLTRLSADGSRLVYSTFTDDGYACCIALDGNGHAVVALPYSAANSSVIESFDAQGSSTAFLETLPVLVNALTADRAGKSISSRKPGPTCL